MPCTQLGTLDGVLALNRQDAKLQFHDGDGRRKEIGSVDGFNPCRHVWIGLSCPKSRQAPSVDHAGGACSVGRALPPPLSSFVPTARDGLSIHAFVR